MDNLGNLKKDKVLKLKYEGKTYKVDITKELSISPGIINTQIKEQPSSFAFIALLKNKAITERDSLEREKDEAYSKAWANIKESDKNLNNDTVSHKANFSKKYVIAYEKWLVAKENAQNLLDVCDAFKMRERLIQTISSNLRKEV